jgi:hypothetical protein
MQWVVDNWILILFGGGMLAMHLFGHGGHGKKHAAASSEEPESKPTSPAVDRVEKHRDR